MNYIEEEKVKVPSKSKWPCKKGKGEHDFSILEKVYDPIPICHLGNKTPNFTSPTYVYRCSVCSKKLYSSKAFKTTKSLDERFNF